MQNNNREKTGNRFVKGRKQEALAEIEAWVGGSREQIIKGITGDQTLKNVHIRRLQFLNFAS